VRVAGAHQRSSLSQHGERPQAGGAWALGSQPDEFSCGQWTARPGIQLRNWRLCFTEICLQPSPLIRNSAAMARQSLTAPRPEPSYPAWKAAAVRALQKLHWSAAAFTRDGLWTKLYVRGFSPEEAAKLAEREYHSTHRPNG